jgi:hypothetical protein
VLGELAVFYPEKVDVGAEVATECALGRDKDEVPCTRDASSSKGRMVRTRLKTRRKSTKK